MLFYITIILTIIFDILTKYLASIFLQDSISLLGDFLYLQFIHNTGIAFSIYLPFLKIITIILIIGIFYYYYKLKAENGKLKDIGFGLILGGAIGNGIERIFFGEVIDFIGVKYFAIFNFADIFITIGVILLLLETILIKKK